MAETETMAPETMMPEMVPLTIGTLHTKRIGLTARQSGPQRICAEGRETVSAWVARGWASNARR